MQDKSNSGNHGFTIIEVIAVLLLVGILVATVLSRSSSGDPYKLASEAGTLKFYLRYAQYRAISDDTSWGMGFAGGSYTLLRGGATSLYTILPNENSATHTLQSGVSAAGPTVTFDVWGRPVDGDVPLDADVTITVSAGSSSETITVKKNTGFIP